MRRGKERRRTYAYNDACRLNNNRECFVITKIRVYKRNSTFINLSDLVEQIGNIGLAETLKKYYNQPFEHEAKSIVAGPSFMQYLNRLFKTQIASGDILQFESGDHDKYFMFSLTGTMYVIHLTTSTGQGE